MNNKGDKVKRCYEPEKDQVTVHTTCTPRLLKEGGSAGCCWCEPHQGCEVAEKVCSCEALKKELVQLQSKFDWVVGDWKKEEVLWKEREMSLLAELEVVRQENEKLRAFADHILQNYSWDNYCAEIDPADAQDKAEELGLIEKRDVNPDDYDGADWAFFTKWTPKESK